MRMPHFGAVGGGGAQDALGLGQIVLDDELTHLKEGGVLAGLTAGAGETVPVKTGPAADSPPGCGP